MTREPVVLPDAARQRVVALAADELGLLKDAEVPAALRPFARFTPAKRARLAAAALAATLESDVAFRGRVADRAREAMPELASAVATGAAPAAADPVLVAVMAYLLRPRGWRELVRAVPTGDVGGELAEATARADRLAAEGTELRRLAKEADREHRRALDDLKAEVQAQKREVQRLAGALRKAEERAGVAEGRLAAERERAGKDLDAVARREKRLQARVAELEAEAGAARTAGRGARAADDVRLRVLLDAVVDAAGGLRRELALAPATDRPADAVATRAEPGAARGQRVADGDTGRLTALLGAPQAHVIVDGYNVTKTRYGGQPLEAQRTRLLRGLQGLAARTQAEITCVFDGADAGVRVPTAVARGVRVRFSSPGQTADELIAEFLRAEPPGRTVLCVSSDNEVVDSALAVGAYAVSSVTLLAVLER